MKSLMWLLDSVLKNTRTRCGTDTHRDYLTISRRIKHEGISFLTITLPTFAKDFERSLDRGYVGHDVFLSFKKNRALPAFLQGLLGQVFDPGDGKLVAKPSVDCIFCIRQICLMFKKIELPCSSQRNKKAFQEFRDCENELASAIDKVSNQDFKDFGFISDMLWSEVCAGVSNKVYRHDLLPRHGPGATAEKIHGNAKYIQKRWHTRLDSVFPFDSYGFPRPDGENGDGFSDVEFIEPGMEQPSRVVSVPKTLKGPRIIAIEPVCMQYTQQAVLTELVRALEHHPVTSGLINFSDQGVNRKLALQSSIDGKLATIDLKEASDRVHKDFVYRMLKSVPHLRDAVFACRTQNAILPEGDVIPLYKFASMGSALCFPIEAMMFFTLCTLGRIRKLNLRLTRRNVIRASRQVFVYGDDILVPSDEVPDVVRCLEAFSLKANAHKTFGTGKFRESCGMDAYAGVDVTPVYVRSMPPDNMRDSSAIVSYVSLANQLFKAGMWETAQRVRNFVESVLCFQLPYVRETASCLGWLNVKDAYSFQRYSSDTQSPEVRSLVVKSTERRDPLTGYYALMKFFLKVGHDPIRGKHLEKTVQRGTANIKFRWARPF